MEDPIAIATLNDFIFCPYSIYLHSVYGNADDDVYKAAPQMQGTIAHQSIDDRHYSTRSTDITSLAVYSERFGVYGKIDLYKGKEEFLIERKYRLKNIYQGQIYQLQAQYFCMIEMGYPVKKMGLHSLSDNKMNIIPIPTKEEENELLDFITLMKTWNPSMEMDTNPNKCSHCIYAALCEKVNSDHVYA